MRGTFVAKPLIYRLEVAGDDFCQGDSLKCSLSIDNPTDQPVTASANRFDLVRADLKKVKSRSDDAFESVIANAECPQELEIGSHQQKKIDWVFALDHNCIISDTAQSLCFLYGSGSSPNLLGPLPFTVKPHRYIQKAITIFESPFQFVPKAQKSVNGWVEVKMKPPTARRLVLVDELLMAFRFDKDALQLKYTFKVKSFDTSASSVNVKKDKTVVEQRLEPNQYLLTEEHLNHEVLESKIQEALDVVSTGL